MKILVVNAGSSSLKYQLIDMDGEKELAKGLVERIGIDGSRLKHSAGEKKTEISQEIPDHEAAAQLMLKILQDPEFGVIRSTDEIGAVGHRVLHGGSAFTASVIVNDAAKQAIRDCFPLGPLHNPANLMGIEACEKVMKGTPQVAVFDTAFHQTMPDYAYMYALPYEFYEKYKIRRYGFHGTSHRFITQYVCDFLGVKKEGLKLITCHIGNGASIAAIKDGKVIDTSMGLTPLEGLVMGTRSGDIDAGVVTFLENKLGVNAAQMSDILNKKSGMLGITGVSSDMRELEVAQKEGNPRAILADKMYNYRIKKYIGAYAAALGGVDVIVFTGGVGENQASMRANALEGMEFLGVKLDPELNAVTVRGKEGLISTADSKVKVVILATDEELMIAQDTMNIVNA